MASNGNSRGKLLTAGGILSIVAGIYQLIPGGLLLVDSLVSYQHGVGLIEVLFLPFLPYAWRYDILWGSGPIPATPAWVPSWWVIIGGCVCVLGILAVVGGISAIRRKKFGLSLAGAICALPSILGILVVIFIALGEREFGAERKKNASNGNSRGKLLTAGGILSIIAGVSQISGGGSVAGNFSGIWGFNPVAILFLPFLPDAWQRDILWGPGLKTLFQGMEIPQVIIGVCVGVLGIVAVVGGISAIRRKRFGLSLAGAICALLSGPFGIMAVIFVSLRKREFGAIRG